MSVTNSSQWGNMLPAVAVAITGGLWGLLWLPMRAFEGSLSGDWLAMLLFIVPTLLLLPLVIWRRKLPPRIFLAVLITGLFTGAGSMLYAVSLVMTTVVKALLLFYLTPVWSTILEYMLLGTRLTASRAVALVMGILGLIVILGADGTLLPGNTGDWVALISGVAWAYGTVRLHSQPEVPLCESTFTYFAGGAMVAIVFILLPFGAFTVVPGVGEIMTHLPAVGVISLLMVGCALLVFWGTLRLSPARVGLLLMFEVVIGIASAALLTEEPFGVRELMGAALITGAAIVEVTQRTAGPVKKPGHASNP